MGKAEDLIEASRAGNYPMVERILRWGTAGNVTFSSQLLLHSIKPKKAGPFASLRRVQGGIGSRDSNGYTALHYASLNGHKEVVELLPYIMKIQYNMYLYFHILYELGGGLVAQLRGVVQLCGRGWLLSSSPSRLGWAL